MKKLTAIIFALSFTVLTVPVHAEMTKKFSGVWKEKATANATFTITPDGDNYKLRIDDRNTGTREYQAVEDKGQLYQVVNDTKRPMFTYVDQNTIKWTKINAELKKQK